MSIAERLKQRFDFIYKGNYPAALLEELESQINKTKSAIRVNSVKWSEEDVVLITYGDSILSKHSNPLSALKKILEQYLGETVSYIHILPFFPYSSDDGFSVIDYLSVNPDLGEWSDIEALKTDYKLMFDLVINHISQHSDWFAHYKAAKAPYKDFFIEVDPESDLSEVVRPRSLPLLTKVDTINGTRHVWTTFSDDQIDLNFAEPKLMAEMIKVFLFYLEKGASMIRLDAIAFLWKVIGTNCLHLPETHEFVKLLRDITDYISPGLILLTETNVPNKENLSYFGDNDEANMVYQFSLPPLLLHCLYTGNSEFLTQWASSVPNLSEDCTFFNFTASHDGVGVRPLEGLVPNDEVFNLVEGMKLFGGKVNTRRNSDGSDSPYELNITYFDALMGTFEGIDELQEARFICSQTIMLTMIGVPAFYIHSFLATQNYTDGIKLTGMNRTINRRKWSEDELIPLLDGDTHHNRILNELIRRINTRKKYKAFHPQSKQEVRNLGKNLFCIIRGEQELFALFNISNREQEINLASELPAKRVKDILSGMPFDTDFGKLMLAPYQALWFVPDN
jgi:sucrose phosphorylase